MAETRSSIGADPGLLPQPYVLILRLVPILLMLAGAGAVLFAFAADWLGMGGLPGIGARQVALALSGAAILLAGAIFIPSLPKQPVGVLLLLGVAAIAIAVVADMFAINTGLATGLDKFILLGAVGTGIVLASVVLSGSTLQEALGNWRRMLLVSGRDVGQIAFIAAELLLIVVVVGQYALENEVFAQNIMWLTFYGFLVHLVLPLPYRLPFFVLLSLVAIAGVFGLINGLWLIALGLGLILICHLPVAFGVRVSLLLVAGAGLALLRTEWGSSGLVLPWSAAIWPILGSMFMFRLIAYMYDLRHQKEAVNYTQTLAYFFLLPNVVFPLFPVVDFTTFRRTYYSEERTRIYQTGIDWMVRGVIHLILYRFVSYYLLIGPEDVTNTSELMRYLVTNFLLYLRVSGQFHLIVGMLHLFGFNLPETHHLYFLASSFTDFWRRINIYWKDFMLKVFYYPAYFRMRKLGATLGLVLATLFVFFATWFLHAYQWFWLRGSFLLAWQDGLFWAILAVLVVINSLVELKQGRKRTLGTRTWTWRELSSVSLRTAFTFLLICVLWSLWTSTSVSDWLSLWTTVDLSWQGVASVAGVLLVIALLAGFMHIRATGATSPARGSTKPVAFFRTAATALASLVLVYLLGTPSVYSLTAGKTQEVLRDLRVARLNTQDAELLERGYYEDLIGVNRFNSQLWEIYSKRPQSRPDIWTTEAAVQTDNFLGVELVPSKSVLFYDKPFTTNRWAMRDKDYEMQKPAGTYRMALIGASHVLGWGVADNETFEWLLEDRLNAENSGNIYKQYEILNFASSGYSTLDRLLVLETKVPPFEPDAVFYVAHPNEAGRSIDNLVARIRDGVDIPFDYVNEIVRKAQVEQDTSLSNAKRQLAPFGDELVSWAYAQIVADSQQQGFLPVWILLPRIVGVDEPEESAYLIDLAEEAGFVVLDLQDVYGPENAESLRLEPWDWHPNPIGHQMIADKLYEILTTEDRLLRR